MYALNVVFVYLSLCYVLFQEHRINSTNTYLERRIKVICYSKTSNKMLPVYLCY